ncbi:TPA: tail fiber domain-containing protein [Enterobacter kobei]|nr:tail fiber domain-containing protein [Enterobacter kobei]HBO1175292.1 tail fiber domain-containing protein [Enterobacter kobei]HBO1179995.1 tail fiber domain-containing protein [Enterobacter kobei]HBO2006759.1 tail fiber domain-containing protein [Enterobacter kobei]HBO2414435.1 tail fiber domain-containing protein [Enterobacter kobei]
MSTGTINLTNGSAVVGGSGTSFATELAAGDFIVSTVGGVPYTLPVKSVESNAQLTLVSNFTGPTQSGAAWSAVPRIALNMVTAALVAQSAEALRGLNYDKQNWQSIFSGTGNVTVTLPDGSSFTGPSWSGITNSLTGKLDKSQNLNDVADKATSLSNLGAAASGNNSDITSLSSVAPPRGAINSRLNGGYSSLLALGSAAGTAVKPFNLNVSRLGNASNNWNFQVTYGFLVGDDGSANASGPILICTDGSSYERRWIFRNTDGAINTSNGTISPGASDERVKNIIREITEEEAVRIIQGLKPIRYSFKWSPEQIKVGYSAQNVEALDAELLSTTPLTIPDPEQPDNPMAGMTIEDGKVVDPGEIGAAYLVPVVQQLLRRVTELEKMLEKR